MFIPIRRLWLGLWILIRSPWGNLRLGWLRASRFLWVGRRGAGRLLRADVCLLWKRLARLRRLICAGLLWRFRDLGMLGLPRLNYLLRRRRGWWRLAIRAAGFLIRGGSILCRLCVIRNVPGLWWECLGLRGFLMMIC